MLVSVQESSSQQGEGCAFILYFLQVGACIVNPDRKIVGIGYNGMPNGCSDDELPWTRVAKNRLDTKYPYGTCIMK